MGKTFELLLFVLTIEASIDIRTYDVYSIFNYLIACIGISASRNSDPLDLFLSLTLLPSVLLILNKFKKGIGNGDIELIFCLGFYFKLKELLIIVLIASIVSIIFALYSHRKKFPFIPFITIAVSIYQFFFVF